jgi:hypothetical protein
MAIASSSFLLLTSAGGRPGDRGFKLTGHAANGAGMCRVWLRHVEPWERAIDPRRLDTSWDVRVSIRQDSAFALQSELKIADLPALAEQFAFPKDPAGLASMANNGDPLHDAVLGWAQATCVPRPPAVEPTTLAAADSWDEAAEVARQTGSVPAVV